MSLSNCVQLSINSFPEGANEGRDCVWCWQRSVVAKVGNLCWSYDAIGMSLT